MKHSDSEHDKFDAGMDALLQANPQAIRAAMEQEKREREEERNAKKKAVDRAEG